MNPSAYALTTADWCVLGGYVALLLGAGWWLSRRQARDTGAYFLAARSMPGWVVAVSILATAQSAATFVGVPEQGYTLDFSYLLTSVGSVAAACVVAAVFLPAYYRLGVQTPYELLETRFGPGARRAASVSYLAGRLLANGARVYIGALPAAMAVFGTPEPGGLQIVACVAVFMVFGAVFTLAGGARAAIYSDVVQVVVYLGAAAVMVVVLLTKIPASVGEVASAVASPPPGAAQPVWFRLGIGDAQPWTEFSLLTALTGMTLLNTAFFAMDQDLTQRLLSCRSAGSAARSLIASTAAVGLPVVALFMVLGVLLNVYYTRADVMGGGGGGARAEGAMIDFALAHSPAGVAGLVFAGLMAAGPAGINSSLNSMASSFVADIYRPARPGREEAHYVRAGRMATVAAGVVMGLLVLLCVYWQRSSGLPLLPFALSVMVFAYAGLLGVFFCAVLTRRGSGSTAVAAMATGFVVVLAMQGFIWRPVTGAKTTPELWEVAPWAALASPWQLCIGTVVAFGVCVAGRRRAGVGARG